MLRPCDGHDQLLVTLHPPDDYMVLLLQPVRPYLMSGTHKREAVWEDEQVLTLHQPSPKASSLSKTSTSSPARNSSSSVCSAWNVCTAHTTVILANDLPDVE